MKKIISNIAEPAHSYSFFVPKEKIAFLDIETTGLSPNASSLYLIGMMYFNTQKNHWQLCQWFADNYRSEKEMLTDFLETLSSFSYLFHFNGKTFDLPYIIKKCKHHAIAIPDTCQKMLLDTRGLYSIDLLTKVRSLRHSLLLDRCNQTSVECWLGVNRTDTFSGKDLIPVYSEYMQQKIIAPENSKKLEKTLLLHNHDDIEMMLELCSMLTYDEYLSARCTKRLLSHENLQSLSVSTLEPNTLEVTLKLPVAVPKSICLFADFPISQAESPCQPRKAELRLQKDTATLILPFFQNTLKFFLPDYRDYYFLPEEDTAVHKSVAEFVDASHRKKATAATCYLKKTGIFLPSLAPKKVTKKDSSATESSSLKAFSQCYRDKLVFYQLPEKHQTDIDFWASYLAIQFPLFR